MPLIHRFASVLAAIALLLCLERGAWGAVAADFLYRTLPKAGAADYDLPYRWLVPTGYDAATSYPLIIFLHGTGEKGTNNTAQLSNNANGALALVSTANQAAYPCFMMAPQANVSTGWYDKNFDQIIAAMQLEMATYHIDPNRIYVTGLSMGGNGTVALVNHAPYLFACAVPMSGWGDTNFQKNCAMPFWVFHAANDGTVGVNGSDNIVNDLRNAGRPVIYTRYDTGGHGIWPTAYANPDLLPWMMAQRRNRAAAGAPRVAFTTPATAVASASGTTLDIAGTAAIPAGITQVTYTYKSWEAGPANDLDTTKRTVLSGTTTWSQTAAPVDNSMGMVIAIGPSGSASLGGTIRASRTQFVNRASSNQTAPAVAVTSPSTTGTFSTAADLLNLGGTASAGGSKTVAEVTWSNDRGGQGTAISTGYGSASLTWSITNLDLAIGANTITVTIRDSLGKITTTTYVATKSGPPAPELGVARGATALTDGGSDTISGTSAGAGTALTYTFANSGTAGLGITAPVSIAAASNCTVSTTTQPATSVVAGAGTNLVLMVTPTAAGAWSFAVSAANTDANESPYDWTVSGSASASVGGTTSGGATSGSTTSGSTTTSGGTTSGSTAGTTAGATAGTTPTSDTEASGGSGGCGVGSSLGLMLMLAALSLRQLRGSR